MTTLILDSTPSSSSLLEMMAVPCLKINTREPTKAFWFPGWNNENKLVSTANGIVGSDELVNYHYTETMTGYHIYFSEDGYSIERTDRPRPSKSFKYPISLCSNVAVYYCGERGECFSFCAIVKIKKKEAIYRAIVASNSSITAGDFELPKTITDLFDREKIMRIAFTGSTCIVFSGDKFYTFTLGSNKASEFSEPCREYHFETFPNKGICIIPLYYDYQNITSVPVYYFHYNKMTKRNIRICHGHLHPGNVTDIKPYFDYVFNPHEGLRGTFKLMVAYCGVYYENEMVGWE